MNNLQTIYDCNIKSFCEKIQASRKLIKKYLALAILNNNEAVLKIGNCYKINFDLFVNFIRFQEQKQEEEKLWQKQIKKNSKISQTEMAFGGLSSHTRAKDMIRALVKHKLLKQ